MSGAMSANDPLFQGVPSRSHRPNGGREGMV
jgi:hypothetical protein